MVINSTWSWRTVLQEPRLRNINCHIYIFLWQIWVETSFQSTQEKTSWFTENCTFLDTSCLDVYLEEQDTKHKSIFRPLSLLQEREFCHVIFSPWSCVTGTSPPVDMKWRKIDTWKRICGTETMRRQKWRLCFDAKFRGENWGATCGIGHF